VKRIPGVTRAALLVALVAVGLLVAALAAPAARAQVALSGLSGYWNAPAARVLADGAVEMGYNTIPMRWAWDHRGQYRNDVYFGTIGFVPRVEFSFRITSIPGFRTFQDVDSLANYTDADRMLSLKVQLLQQSRVLPDVAFGVEDLQGTRRFHTSYLVAGRSLRAGPVGLRADAGVAFGLLSPRQRTTLDGVFAGLEARPLDVLALVGEYDTEKWNLGFKVRAPLGLTARCVWLGARHISGGVGLQFRL
jgi:hypothetical protein